MFCESEPQTPSPGFHALGVAPQILAILARKNFTTPTPIQQQSIPAGIEGKDIVGIAQTGTGKTFAFGIPMLQRLLQGTGRGLVIVPTRELAYQVEESLQTFTPDLKIRTAVLVGGASMLFAAPGHPAKSEDCDCDAGAPAGSPDAADDHAQGSHCPRPRRGGSDVRHGFPTADRTDPEARSKEPSDAPLLRDDAAGYFETRAPGRCTCRLELKWRLRGRPSPKCSRKSSLFRNRTRSLFWMLSFRNIPAPRSCFHGRSTARAKSQPASAPWAIRPRRFMPISLSAASRGARGLQIRQVPGSDRDRHRRPRHRRRGHHARCQF